jgi:hypothetical protein
LALLGAQKGGATQAGILFLANMHETTDDKDARKAIEMRIEALKGVLVIEKAIETFTAKFNREPDTLEELTTKGILGSLPINPYLKEYQYKDGQIEF